jgi:hypothetical protein
MPTPLSPAAQAIVQAFDDRYELLGPLEDDWQEQCLAAALRAVANQVQLALPLGDTDADAGVFAAHHAIRTAILAIATELKGHG